MNSTQQASSPSPEARAAAHQTRLGRLAGWCYDRRKLVLVLWIVAVVAISVIGARAGSSYSDKFSGGNSESAKALHLLQHRFPAKAGDTMDVVFHSTDDINTHQSQVQDVVDQIAALGKKYNVDGVVSPYSAEGAGQVARQAPGKDHIVYATVQFDKETVDIPKASVKKVLSTARGIANNGLQVEFGGGPVYKAEPPSIGSAEGFGIIAAMIILFLAFGSLIAMGLPLLTAFFGIAIGSAVVALVSHIMTVPSFAPQMALMIGLGVGIDYALFLVTRYRDELHAGRTPRDSVIVAMATAGHAVVFAGCTVVISLLGMFLMQQPFIYGLAVGCISIVVLVMASALTLLPGILGFVGYTIDRIHLPGLLHKGDQGEGRATFWYRWSRVVQRRPWVTGGIALVLLLALALPLFGMRMGQTDAGNDPVKSTIRKSYDLLAEGFGPGSNGPLIVALDLPSSNGKAAVEKLHSKLQGLMADPNGNVAFVVPLTPQSFSPSGDAARVVVIPKSAPQAKATDSLVHRLRNDLVPNTLDGTGVTGYVGGQTAGGIDGSAGLVHRLPWVIGGVVILSFLLLMAVFRSVAVPLKAAVMNLLSIGAAYGVIVAVFQWGWLGGFFGIGHTGPIDSWIPLMLFTILFGLSMDYEVFLLSRIREEWLSHGRNDLAVADGLAATARVITAAAAIMVFVFGSFILGDLRQLKLFGLGLATAVLVDATLVRMILVPSTMEILGGANWWFPAWLDRVVPKLSVEVEVEPVEEREPALVD
jgi:RND superfamily putative drug exporter